MSKTEELSLIHHSSDLSPKASALEQLLQALSHVQVVADTTGRDLSALLVQLSEQIRQCLTGGDIKSGAGVTKSGEDD